MCSSLYYAQEGTIQRLERLDLFTYGLKFSEIYSGTMVYYYSMRNALYTDYYITLFHVPINFVCRP